MTLLMIPKIFFRPCVSSLRCREKTRASRSDNFPGGRSATEAGYPEKIIDSRFRNRGGHGKMERIFHLISGFKI